MSGVRVPSLTPLKPQVSALTCDYVGLHGSVLSDPGSGIVRARFFDDFLQRVTAGGNQAGSAGGRGLDRRAYRLSWPDDVRVFEPDQPEVLARKQKFLDSAGAKPGCARLPIGVNLAGQWTAPLLGAGFDPGTPSCWLAEGFLFYLPPDGITRILDQVTRLAAAGSRLGFDIVNSATLTHPLTRPWIDMQARAGAPWLGTLDDPAGFLAGRGWQVVGQGLGDVPLVPDARTRIVLRAATGMATDPRPQPVVAQLILVLPSAVQAARRVPPVR